MPDKNKRIANWIYCNGSAIADQAKRYRNTVLLYYLLERLFGIDRGIVYILEQMFDCRKGYICSIHKLLVKSAFPRHFTSNSPKTPLRYRVRQNDHFTPFSPIPTMPKTTTYHSKIPSSP